MTGASGPDNPRRVIAEAFEEGGTVTAKNFNWLPAVIKRTGSVLLEFSVFGNPVDAVFMLIQVPQAKVGALVNEFVKDDRSKYPLKIEVLSNYTLSPPNVLICVTWGPGG